MVVLLKSGVVNHYYYNKQTICLGGLLCKSYRNFQGIIVFG